MTKPTADRVRAWRSIMHIHASVMGATDDVLERELGIPASWYEALVEIAFAGGAMRMNDFATETTLTRSGATRFADRLEDAGLVERRTYPEDRRGLELVLTDKGKKTQKAADPYVLETLHERFGKYLTDEEAAVIADALARVRGETV